MSRMARNPIKMQPRREGYIYCLLLYGLSDSNNVDDYFANPRVAGIC